MGLEQVSERKKMREERSDHNFPVALELTMKF